MNLTYKNVKFITISAKNSKKLDRLIFSCINKYSWSFSGPDSYFYTQVRKRRILSMKKNTSNVVHNIEEVFRCPADV